MSDATDGDFGRYLCKAGATPVRMYDDAFSRAGQAAVERKIDWARDERRRSAPGQRFSRCLSRRLAVTRPDFVEINPQVAAGAGQAQKKILQSKIVKDDDAAVLLHRFADAGVIPVVVAHVMQHRIKTIEIVQALRLAAIITNFESGLQ